MKITIFQLYLVIAFLTILYGVVSLNVVITALGSTLLILLLISHVNILRYELQETTYSDTVAH